MMSISKFRPWKLTIAIVVTMVVTSWLGLLYFQVFRSLEQAARAAQQDLVDDVARLAPTMWEALAAEVERGTPSNALPIPAGDPAPALDQMMGSPFVSLAYHISPDMKLTLRMRWTFEKGTEAIEVKRDLKTWSPIVLFESTRGRDWRENMADEFVSTLLNTDIGRSYRMGWGNDNFKLDAAIPMGRAADGAPRYVYREVSGAEGFTIEPLGTNWTHQMKGSPKSGYLGYSVDVPDLIAQAGEPIIERAGLSGRAEWLDGYWREADPALQLSARTTKLFNVGLGVVTRDDFTDHRLNYLYRSVALLLTLIVLGVLSVSVLVRQIHAMAMERSIALAQSNFVSGVSHEMRTPLTTIKMYAEMLAQGLVKEEAKREQYLETIGQECDRLTRLIENVLDYARISGRRREYRFEALELRGVIEEAVTALEGPLQLAGKQVDLILPPTAHVHADRDALVQSVINLLSNAIKYAPGEKRILVSAETTEREICIHVQDFGPGIPPAELKRIFKPFYRVGSELTRHTTGSGLGLTLVEEHMKAHRGSVAVASRPAEGAVFSLVLPQEGSVT